MIGLDLQGALHLSQRALIVSTLGELDGPSQVLVRRHVPALRSSIHNSQAKSDLTHCTSDCARETLVLSVAVAGRMRST